jgi:hypothetical protein
VRRGRSSRVGVNADESLTDREFDPETGDMTADLAVLCVDVAAGARERRAATRTTACSCNSHSGGDQRPMLALVAASVRWALSTIDA